MYTNFRIQNFRGFKDLELKDLARVNLISGKNNVGKTALLEALFIYTNPYRPDLALNVYNFRGIQRFTIEYGNLTDFPLATLFHKYELDSYVQLSGQSLDNENWTLKIRTVPQNELREIGSIRQRNRSLDDNMQTTLDTNQVLCFEVHHSQDEVQNYYMVMEEQGYELFPIPPVRERQAVFAVSRMRTSHSDDARRFTSLKKQGKYDLLLNALKVVEERLTNIELLEYGGETLLHGELGDDRPIPLPLMGDGLNRLASLVLSMVTASNGFLLIDEIENGLHYSVQEDIWEAIGIASKQFNVQVFATTHSLEMIRAAQQAFAKTDEDDFRYYRIDLHPKTHEPLAVRFAPETMDAAVRMNYEVRG